MIIGSKIIYFDNLTSTNSHAINLLSTKKPDEGTIIRAGFQSSGRGQPGNVWESEPGKNLLFSIILYPVNISPSNQFLVSMCISLGMHDYLSKIFEGVTIKWPNDIYVNNDKIAGILLESSTMGNELVYMVAGIGLNVNQELFKGSAPNPVSMKLLSGNNYPPDAVLSELAHSLDNRYNELGSGKYGLVKKEYNSRLFRIDQWTIFRDKEGEFTGKIERVDQTGRMTVERKTGRKTEYYFKEIEFIF